MHHLSCDIFYAILNGIKICNLESKFDSHNELVGVEEAKKLLMDLCNKKNKIIWLIFITFSKVVELFKNFDLGKIILFKKKIFSGDGILAV